MECGVIRGLFKPSPGFSKLHPGYKESFLLFGHCGQINCMVKINKQRMAPVIDESFVVFLVGMRINSLWKVHKWLPLYLKMSKIVKELADTTDIGFMGCESWMGNPRLIIQYWRSYDELLAYARNKDATHFPTWVSFNETIGRSADVGVWHETYVIEPGNCEAVYTHMPAFGLGKATRLDGNAKLRIKQKEK